MVIVVFANKVQSVQFKLNVFNENLTCLSQVKTNGSKRDQLILVIAENQCYLIDCYRLSIDINR